MKKVEMPSKFPLIYVEWVDAESDSEWEELEPTEIWANKDKSVQEIGWLILETQKFIVICSQLDNDKNFGNRTKIPKEWIRKLQKVSLVRRKK